jgi:predicted TIM-barrel fold metal-dependent hydrolase
LFLFDLSAASLLTNDLDIGPYEKRSGISCSSLADWKRLIDWYFERWGKRVVAVKNQCSYWRPLVFEDVPETTAAPLFEKWLLRKEKVTEQEKRMVQDYTYHHVIRRAIDLDLPLKIHTGYHAGTWYMNLDFTKPAGLAGLFRKYPTARFDLFHIGYPYQMEVIALAKHYPNVRVNMCWAWIMDPAASLEFARSALGSLPSNKVFGFGGDYGYADNVYGHLRIARDGIALVLTEAVRQGRLTRADAKVIARRWLRENAMEFFRIDRKRAIQLGRQPQT